MNRDYKITEEDIQIVVEYLKLTAPEKANSTFARKVLEEMYVSLHTFSHLKPEYIDEVVKRLELE